MGYQFLSEIVVEASKAARPPERLTVVESSEKYIKVVNPGSYTGPWKRTFAPYVAEVMEQLTRHDLKSVCFVAPAQSGKTEIGLSWLAYSVICDPMNFMIVEKTEKDARDFSRQRVDKLIFNCPEVRKRLGGSKHSDNVFDKRFSSGMALSIRSPTINTLSGKPIPRLAFSDYDRMDQNLDGEGSPFILASGRITSFTHFGMIFVESSPSFPITDARWTPETPHAAPPCEGIIGIYNQGDRRRWYWICVDCDEAFEPDFKLLRWPEGLSHFESGQQCWLECPHCGSIYHHETRDGKPGKHGLNATGMWLTDGQRRLKGGEIVGEARRSSMASFWLKGVAAAFKEWPDIVESWLSANEHYERTGDEEQLKGTTNVHQGVPYLPKHLESERLPEEIRDRAVDFGQREVPPDVRFLIGAVDVQKRRFVVQIHGVSEGGDMWVIDRFDIKYSLDRDEMRPDQFRWVSPAYEAKDWRILLREVLLRDYPLADKSGRSMAVKAVVCDSGGLSGTTSNAYALWHWLRRGPQPEDEDYDEWVNEWTPGLQNRLALYKGDANTLARVILSYPESPRMAKGTGARGAPVLRCNANMLKDQLNSMLDRLAKGTGRIRFPKWLPISFYRELCAETRDVDGKWINPKGFRNESWDLFVMSIAMLIERKYVGIETMNWSDPPSWAQSHGTNDLIFGGTDKSPIIHERNDNMSVEELAKLLG